MSLSLRETGIMLALNLQKSSKEGLLLDLKVAVKDLFNIKGVATTAGNPDWLTTHKIPTQSASAVEKLLDAGATVIGKSLTDELAYSLNGTNIHYGTPVNYSSPQRIPGGSSSGSAVAVSSGIADIGLGTDTGGSIRVPASYNGLFGLRPTHGLIEMDNMVPLAPSFDTVGWLTKDIETLAKVAEVLLPNALLCEETEPKNMVVLKPEIAGKSIWNSDIDKWIDDHKSQFESIQEVVLEGSFYTKASEAFRILQGAEIWQTHGEWIEKENPLFSPDIQARFEWCKTISPSEIDKASDVRQEVIQTLDSILPDESSVMLLPTTPGAAPLLDSSREFMDEYRIQLMELTALAGLSARPQLHLPVLKEQNAPWGVSLLGANNSDVNLIGLAKNLID